MVTGLGVTPPNQLFSTFDEETPPRSMAPISPNTERALHSINHIKCVAVLRIIKALFFALTEVA
jgi:hypothetical protein